jgi:hypothetical protein
MDVQSDVGKGTVFSVYLPATREVLAGSEEPLSIDGYLGKGEFILVVDDAPAQRELARSMLERLGYKVDVVGSGEEAVVYLPPAPERWILGRGWTDHGGPVWMGWKPTEGLAENRSLQGQAGPSIVSGFFGNRPGRRAQAMGAPGHLFANPIFSEKIGLGRQEGELRPGPRFCFFQTISMVYEKQKGRMEGFCFPAARSGRDEPSSPPQGGPDQRFRSPQ